jgi:D-xylose transport system permease protein
MNDNARATSSAPPPTSSAPPAEATPSEAAKSQVHSEGLFSAGNIGQLPVVLTLIIIVVFFQITSGGYFLVAQNLSNLFLQIATIGCISLGAVLVLLIGEIDLSLAAVAFFSGGVLVVASVRNGQPAWLALLITLLVGIGIGTLNGFFVAVMRIPSFIVTLAGLIFYTGLLLHIELPQTTIIVSDPFLQGIATKYLPDTLGIGLPLVAVAVYVIGVLLNRLARQRNGLPQPSLWRTMVRLGLAIALTIAAVTLFESYRGVPYSAAILFILIIVAWLMLRFTSFGRHVYAVGGNAEAARRAGIRVTGLRIGLFAMASMLAAIGGILETSRAGSADTNVDSSFLLQAIAAAVIGGVSLFGGRGSAWAVVLGILVIGSLSNGLVLLNQGQDITEIVEGAVLLGAVLADALIRRRSVTGYR